jgi:endo-1,4-beta-mannosidase
MLIRQGAPLDAIWAYSLANEAYFASDAPPLSLESGTVTTANGRSYDMSNTAQRRAMMDEGLVYWIDHVRAAIREVDPTALITIGFFQPKGPNPTRIGDPRVIKTGAVITQSQADFIDLHLYPGLELSLPQYVQNFELPQVTAKPIVMGEFGAFKTPYPTVSAAANAVRLWQIESCRYGFDGWLFWTWDTTEAAEGEPPLWNAMSESRVIAQALAPKSHPDACG